MTDDGGRRELLLKMYDQMFSDINRHILVVWQSVGVVIGAFAILALAEKNVVSLDVSIALIIFLCAWLVAHLYDAGYWYNRNLIIIANIERQFLMESDLKDIHYYFGRHRPNNPMLTHLKVQYGLAVAIASLMMLYHFTERLLPGILASDSQLDLQRGLPFVALIVSVVYLVKIAGQRDSAYQEFLRNSPGAKVLTTDIEYGVGHGHKKSDQLPPSGEKAMNQHSSAKRGDEAGKRS